MTILITFKRTNSASYVPRIFGAIVEPKDLIFAYFNPINEPDATVRSGINFTICSLISALLLTILSFLSISGFFCVYFGEVMSNFF